MGYVEETGAAQHFRDARIAPIYEGTNGIQAIDLVMRKLPMRNGAVVTEFLQSMNATADELAAIENYTVSAQRLRDAVTALAEASTWLGRRLAAGEYNDALAGATPYLRMFGTVAGGWFMARSAIAARTALDAGTGERTFLVAKLATARFYLEQLTPQAAGLLPAVTADADTLYEVSLAAL